MFAMYESEAVSYEPHSNNELHNHHPHATPALKPTPFQTLFTHFLFHISLFEISYLYLLSTLSTLISLSSFSLLLLFLLL